MDIWKELFWLQGDVIETLDRKKPFVIDRFDDSGLVVIPQSTGKERFIHRSEIEGTFNQLWVAHELTIQTIRDQHSEANPTYVAAILAQLHEVEFRRKPITLLWVG